MASLAELAAEVASTLADGLDLLPALDGDELRLSASYDGSLNVHGLTAAQVLAVERHCPDAERVDWGGSRWLRVRRGAVSVALFADRQEWDALVQHAAAVAEPGTESIKAGGNGDS